MSFDNYSYPVAISRLSELESSREAQNIRAIKWLLGQVGGSIVVVTPQKSFDSTSITRLIVTPGVVHWTWRGFSTDRLAKHRVLYVHPDRQRLNDLWGIEIDALVVIEWGEPETADWLDVANPVQLFAQETIEPVSENQYDGAPSPLPNGVEEILKYVATMAAAYSTGLKWDAEERFKADMMNYPERWVSISAEQYVQNAVSSELARMIQT